MLIDIKPQSARPNPWNPNKVDPINQDKLEASLNADGQTLPIIVRQVKGTAGYEIIDGEHRVAAAIALGWATIQAKNVGEMSDEVAKKATLIANSRYGENDQELLYELLSSENFESMEHLLSTLPIDETEINSLFEHATYDFDALEEDLDKDEPTPPEDLDIGKGKPIETHKILRFKIEAADAEALTDKINEIISRDGLGSEDRLMAAGSALLVLVEGLL